ncbi:hypothetical protein ACFYNO_17940 [Kitasatospora sp. NPDC006697]|uniref:hypothetical protein n=1 Tax=Kitasatospora sp. NPDC006697 TaxID=3364020 RepID=UPI00367E116E
MTTNTKPNQQFLADVASLSTPEVFGRNLLRDILQVAAKHPDPTKPIEFPATIRVFPTSESIVDHGNEVCVGQLLDSGTFVGVCYSHELKM